jgi:hypothetical protein
MLYDDSGHILPVSRDRRDIPRFSSSSVRINRPARYPSRLTYR